MKILKLLYLLIIPSVLLANSIDDYSIKYIEFESKLLSPKDSTVQTDSTVRKYLIVRSYRWYRRSYIFKDNKRLKVTTLQGGVMRGRLKILDDSSFILYNTMNSKLDTFRISELYKINNVSLGANVAAGFAGATGTGLMFGGYNTYQYNSNSFEYTILGFFMMVAGAGSTLATISMINGKPLPNYRYAYVIYQTKGKKLRYWDIRKILPR